ncbi:MAG: PAS domain S-box protein [Chitinophagaceae bacterium]|nr:PAS domain S-box protein [Chitinophagaceae bacterium]
MTVLKKTYILLAVVIICGFIGLTVMTANYQKAFTEASVSVHHTLVVLDKTQQALSAVLQQDLGQDAGAIVHHVQVLGRYTADNPVQQRRVDSLLSYIQAFSQGQPGSTVEQTRVLRAILLRMQGEENRLLVLKEAANIKSRVMWRNAILGLIGVLFLLLVGCSYLISYQLNRRRIAEQGLIESEHRFSLLVQHVNDYAIFMIDPQGKVVTWNRGAGQIKGYEAHEIIGRHISVFYTDEDIERQTPEDNLVKAAEMGSFENVGLRKRKDGSVFYADVVFTCMRNDSGEITGYIKITKDITNQMKAAEEMKLSLQREKDLNEMKSRFVSLASHEFKTPLSVILSSTSLIEKYSAPEMADKRMRHIQRIKSNVKNLRQILGDFLSLEKLEEGVVRNSPSAANIVELGEEVITDMEESCKSGQRIELEIRGEPRVVTVDVHLLRNILNNLLSNAVKYSPEHTSARFIIEFLTSSIRFTVADNGIGIPTEELEHLFERFFRASNTSGISGTGLGLSIVKKYLDLMEGQIDVTSEPGKGTTFTITIPVSDEPHSVLHGRNIHERNQPST